MNGFYTCLLGNAFTIMVTSGNTKVTIVLLVVAAGAAIVCERAHIERFLRIGSYK